MKIILAAMLLISFSSISYAQECKKPGVPNFDKGRYYLPAEGKQGERIENRLKRHHQRSCSVQL